MASKRSAASKYPSKYGKSRWVTAAQWLAELMCERRARAERKTLPPEFWKDGFWGAVYRQQVAAANRLMRRFDQDGSGTGAAAVSAFLRGERGRTCYSLAGAWVVPLVEAAHKAVAFRRGGPAPAPGPDPEPEPEPPPVVTGARTAFVPRRSTLNKLEGL
jgi:hypothetical protein